MFPINPTLMDMNNWSVGTLPGFLGIEIMEIDPKRLLSQLKIRPEHLAPNGYLHAGTIVTLADTSAGYATIANRPSGAENFTTIELKTNFLGTMREGLLRCEAKLVHGGRTTQVWDVTVTNAENERAIALFRCTQMILYPQAK